MKTAESLLNYLLSCFEIELYELKESNPELIENTIKLIQDDRREAIKADREHLLNYAQAKENPNDYGTGEIWVDRNLIINAPNIKLL